MTERGERINWIDWLKVLVVFGAFVFHAAQPFVLTGWLINYPEHSPVLAIYSGFGYLFGMPLMFFLAGATTWLAVRGRGIGGHTGLRVRRLVLPLVLGLIILSPLQAYVAALASGGPADIGAFPAAYLGSLTFSFSPRWFGEYGYHLWFLAFLLVYVVASIPYLSWLLRQPDASQPLPGNGLSGRSARLLPLAVLLATQAVLRPLAPAYRDWADFFLWLGYFLVGVTALADRRLLVALLEHRRLVLWTMPVVLIMLVPMLSHASPLELEHDPGFSLIGLAYISWRTVVGWLMVLVLIGFGSVYLTARPAVLSWASPRVLPFYVIHHPVVVVVAAALVGVGWGLWATFGAILAVSLAVTLALCLPFGRGRR